VSIYTVNIQGQLLDAEKIALCKEININVAPPIVTWGSANTYLWGLASDARRGYYRVEGRDLAIIALSDAFCKAKRESSSHKSSYERLQEQYNTLQKSYESVQKSYTQIQAESNDNLNKCKSAETQLIALKALNSQLQAQVQPFAQVRQELEQVKQALKISEESVAKKTAENEQRKQEREKLESDVDELKNRIATMQKDHISEITKLNKEHKATVGLELKKITAMLSKLGEGYGSETDSHN
jgi:chromosome segregation ATPase